MKRFTMMMSDEDRAALEALRARCGLRSEADAVRRLIEWSPKVPGFLGISVVADSPMPSGVVEVRGSAGSGRIINVGPPSGDAVFTEKALGSTTATVESVASIAPVGRKRPPQDVIDKMPAWQREKFGWR